MHDKPQRIQLSRRKGFNLQAHSLAVNGLPAVKVDRTTPWGNPFIVGIHGTAAECVDLHRKLMAGYLWVSAGNADAQSQHHRYVTKHHKKLTGFNLACWCSLDRPCHANTLLEIANR